MKKNPLLFFILTFILNCNIAYSQVNTEKMRQWADSFGFSGNIMLSSKLIKGNSDLLQADAKVNVLYRHKKHLFFSLNNFSQTRSGDNKFVDRGFSLLRYNYEFTPKYIWEIFVQIEFNHLRKLNSRYLYGTAFRYVPIHKENIYLALGITVMREEESVGDVLSVKYRKSDYLTFEFKLSDNLKFSNTIYYQPQIDNWSNYRILNEGVISVKVFKRLELWAAVQYRYDSKPLEVLENYDVEFKNGIKINF